MKQLILLPIILIVLGLSADIDTVTVKVPIMIISDTDTLIDTCVHFHKMLSGETWVLKEDSEDSYNETVIIKKLEE